MEVTRSHPCLSTHSPWSRSPLSSSGLQVGFTQPWLKPLCPAGAKNGRQGSFYKPLLQLEDSKGASLACSRTELMSLRAPKILQPCHERAQCRDLLLGTLPPTSCPGAPGRS